MNRSINTTGSEKGWLLFFYSVPSKPVSSRMKIWRRLAKAGAVQLKGAVYILPHSEEHYEFFGWLVSEVTLMRGDAVFVKVDSVETMKKSDIIDIFNQQREKDYHKVAEGVEDLERKVSSIRKGNGIQSTKRLSEAVERYLKEYEEIRKVDFFSSKEGNDLKKRIKALESGVRGISGTAVKEKETVTVAPRRIQDYQGKRWVTREKPFVDRIASAWLIKRFIDRDAEFQFMEEKEIENLDKSVVTFDVRGGEFTHIGDLCTFEVLLRTFRLQDKALKKMAEIVHDLDIKDGKYQSEESKGIEGILRGLRKTEKDDREALEKGMAVIELFYVSRIKFNFMEEIIMPPVEKHFKTSLEKTGKEYKEVHEWMDGDPEKKAERHNLTRMYEYGRMIEDQYGKEALQEYIQHLHDDVKAKFTHIQQDLEKAIADTLAYFGVK